MKDAHDSVDTTREWTKRDGGDAVHKEVVTVLLPARNEEQGILQTLEAIPVDALKARGFDVEILVVDGRSSDRTLELAKAFGARILVQEGSGKGHAVREALEKARGSIVVMIDADDTYPAECIPMFVDAVASGETDVILGSRIRGLREPGSMRPLNLFGNVCLSAMGATLYARRVSDVCSGMWAFRRDDALAAGIESRGFDLEAELFAKFSRLGLRMNEYPITYRARLGDTKLSSLRDGFRIASRLLRERFRIIDGESPVPSKSRAKADAPQPTPRANRRSRREGA